MNTINLHLYLVLDAATCGERQRSAKVMATFSRLRRTAAGSR